MNNSDILSIIENQKQEVSHIHQEFSQKYIVFSIQKKLYAIHSEKVLEVFLSENLFYIPFCPQYIPGFLNRYGEPYTVIDLLALLENEKQISHKYLILRSKEDQIAFMIEDVIDITSFSKEKILLLSSKELEEDFFIGIIQMEPTNVMILNLDKVLDRLDKDIE